MDKKTLIDRVVHLTNNSELKAKGLSAQGKQLGNLIFKSKAWLDSKHVELAKRIIEIRRRIWEMAHLEFFLLLCFTEEPLRYHHPTPQLT
tara:strand:- start:387 stop:656 length:270 start_codon:yes stop_codon:yes gene_type:complete